MRLQVKSSAPARSQARPRPTHVSRWMSRPVMTVTPRDTLRTARELMAENRINQLPVVRGGRLVGILTRSDVLDYLLSRSR